MVNPSRLFALAAEPEEAANDWEHFLLACRENGIKKAPPIMPLFGNSRFLTRFAIRHPDLAVAPLKPTHQNLTLQKIRLFKYSQLLHLTLKDLAGAPQETILKELSKLALTILQAVDAQVLGGVKKGYHLITLGKLGGRELNYSSDIDLLVAAQDDKNIEFFSRHARAVASALQTTTDEGFLYRVDWDLRPEGKGGSLVNSLAALSSYYESFGSDWERQALTKAAPGTGTPSVFKAFHRAIEPFVYRKSLDHESVAGILSMKQRIHEDLSRKGGEGFNVKLGIGGIREIEFFTQAFLLIFGGREPALRDTGTLGALKKLAKARFLAKGVSETMMADYLFLRKLEHRLQLVDEAQTHTLPPGDEQALKAARRMGYAEPDPEAALTRFQSDLQGVTERVNRAFIHLFAEKKTRVVVLNERLQNAETFEKKLNEIRIYKKEETAEIKKMEERLGVSRREILQKLSHLAEAICQAGLKMARDMLLPLYGAPMTGLGVAREAHLVTIGMGKMGGSEINYFSDLDLIFIFSGHGETTGPKIISNTEFFSRLVQKFISILSVPTWTGSAYEVDCELRPSGHAGPLVTTLESFLDYQREVSQIWERQALTKARPLAGSAYWAGLVQTQFSSLLYSAPYPENIRREMHRLRMRVEKEVARETARSCDFKGGRGGIMDIEFILQYLQLRHGSTHPTLQTPSTFDGLDAVIALNLLPDPDGVFLKEAYTYYRTLESKLTLSAGRSLRKCEPVKEYLDYRERVRKIYDRIFL